MSRHLAYQTPSHQLLCPHLAHRLRIQSQFPRLQKTAVFQYPFSFAIPPPIHSGFSSEFLMVQGSFVQSTNPEACRLPVRPFQTSAKSFPLEDSLSGPMTLLASIPPLCKILSHNGTTGTVLQVPISRIDLSSTIPTSTYSRSHPTTFSSTQSIPYKIKGASSGVGTLPPSPHLSCHSFRPNLLVDDFGLPFNHSLITEKESLWITKGQVDAVVSTVGRGSPSICRHSLVSPQPCTISTRPIACVGLPSRSLAMSEQFSATDASKKSFLTLIIGYLRGGGDIAMLPTSIFPQRHLNQYSY